MRKPDPGEQLGASGRLGTARISAWSPVGAADTPVWQQD